VEPKLCFSAARFSLRRSFRVFCGFFFASFFGLSEPFMHPAYRAVRLRSICRRRRDNRDVRAPRILAASALVALALPAAASAHANLIRSDPPTGVVLDSGPTEVRLYFDDSIRTQPGTKAIRNRGGASILDGSPHVVGSRELVVPLQRPLARGDYTVLWRALSDDGHSLGGIVTFGIQTGGRRPTAALSVPTGRSPIGVFARWLFFAGVLGAAGATLFRLAIGAAASSTRIPLVGFALVVAGGSILAARATLSTRFGLTALIAVAIAAAGIAAWGIARLDRRAVVFVWASALALLPVPSIGGHALDAGRSWVELPIDIAHITAASVWFGGLLSLVLLLRRTAIESDVVRRFSNVALTSVLVVAATGVLRAFAELGAVAHLWSTSYGHWLIVKTVVLGALVAIAWFNRYRILVREPPSERALRRTTGGEVALFVVLIAAVALLTQSRPGRDALSPTARAAVVGRQASAPDASAVVLSQSGNTIELAGRVGNAFALGTRSVFWQPVAEEGEATSIVGRNLDAERTSTIVGGVAPQYAVAATPRRIVYATATLPPRLVAVQPNGRGKIVLARELVAPFAVRGNRVAWAEHDGARLRVVVHNLETGADWVAAALPACVHGRCYRIDAVTLADRGVAFDRGATGGQPSLVVRRAFDAPRPDVLSVPRDPQPDLVPASSGVAYFVLDRGWFLWPFGQARPRRVELPQDVQPLRNETGTWLAIRRVACSDTLVTVERSGAVRTLVTPQSVRARVGVDGSLCVTNAGLSFVDRRPLTTWVVSPRDSHSDLGVTSLVLLGHPIG
jgi:copper transport protein